jgi:Flp pilus assembly pilin Flp
MKRALTSILAQIRTLIVREEGQDLVEYGLVVTLLALAAIVSMGKIALAIVSLLTPISGIT